MACKHPILIRNRSYHSKKFSFRENKDVYFSNLALAPWDVSRKYLLVPCGKCEECLRSIRNQWYVRIERELARCFVERKQAVFITITIHPRHYDKAIIDPSSFIRKWFERIRHVLGYSFKHVLFQEFGTHGKGEPRLHFHGFLFDFDILYEELRNIVSDFGFIWISQATHKRARYAVKYVVKQIAVPDSHYDRKITVDGIETTLGKLLSHKRYARKFVSSHLGDFLGSMPRPTDTVSTWSYLDFKTKRNFSYKIPRYYDKYLKPEEKIRRAVRSADLYARLCGDSMVKRIVSLCVDRFLSHSSLSYRSHYTWMRKRFSEFLNGRIELPKVCVPRWINYRIEDSWRNFYDIDAQPLLTKYLIKWQNNLSFLM